MKKWILWLCVVVMFTGCTSTNLSKKAQVENLDEELTGNQQLLEQMRDIQYLFIDEDAVQAGRLLDLKGNHSYETLKKNTNEKGTIDFRVQVNQPELVNQVDKRYTLEGYLEYYNSIKKKKYPESKGQHQVKKHKETDKLSKSHVYAVSESDQYQYIYCSVCREYVGAYGKALSNQLNQEMKDKPAFSSLLLWMRQVEERALGQEYEFTTRKDDAYSPTDYIYNESAVINQVAYSYTPFGPSGTILTAEYIPASIYIPTKYQQFLQEFPVKHALLSNYYLNGKIEELEFRTMRNYFNDEEDYFLLNEDGTYKTVSLDATLRLLVKFSNDKPSRVEVHTVNGIISDIGVGESNLQDIYTLLGSMGVTTSTSAHALKMIRTEFNNYFRSLESISGMGASSFQVNRPAREFQSTGDLDGLKWKNQLIGNMNSGGTGWTEIVLYK